MSNRRFRATTGAFAADTRGEADAPSDLDSPSTVPEMPTAVTDAAGQVVQTGAKAIAVDDVLERALVRDYTKTIGSLDRIPVATVQLLDIPTGGIGPREAFLLTQIDGMLSIDDLLDVSGLPRVEALRVLVRLMQLGYVRVD